MLTFFKKDDTNDIAPGRTVPPADGTHEGVPGDSAGLDVLKAAAKRKRGRPPGTGPKPRVDALPSERKENPPPVFDGKAWEAVAALPFNVRKAMTGSEIFALDKEERKILGDSLAAVMNTLIQLDPRYVALAVFTTNITSIFAERELAYRLTRKKDVNEGL